MFSNHKTTNKYLALLIFLVSLVVYSLTLAPTASFWDAGEFIAVAHGLQVNHPPGAPLYSIVGRIFSMFVPTEYVALSINFMSALSSALTIMLLYLIIVRLVREFKGEVSLMSTMDKIGMYGGAIVGALTFAFTDTFWFNAVEAEVYAISIFFTAIVVWLALKWSEQHDEPYNERWLVMIAYMFGLAIGVHLLNLLALFFVALIIYFKRKDYSLFSFGLMGVLAVLSFFLIYPFTIQTIPDIASKIGAATYGLIGPMTFIFLVIIGVIFGIYYTQKRKYRLANIALISYLMILIGYSSYSVIMIRSIANPPIDENDPETVEAFVKYLKREQYGATPILKGNNFDDVTGQIDRTSESFFPRRYSQDPNHLKYYSRFDSDWSYFWNYQINHMYIRYFNWNFIGRASDIQDTGWQSGFSEPVYPNNKASNSYFYIPFLLGIFGLIYHYSTDKKRAFAVSILFVVTGLAIIIFLNQPPYQPRERDYAYVGSYFAFAIWIGLGVTGLIDLLKSYLKEQPAMAYAIVGLCLIGSPVLMAYQNWDDHDRSARYVAPDYAKNLLNSVAPNAILFTNGDNDTFPLWYAQEVEGIRTDVRIVCLSLLNTDWYIKQLKKQWSHESAPLPINLSDEEIDNMTAGLSAWQPTQLSIPVDKEMLRKAFSEDSQYKEAIGVKPDNEIPILQTGTDFEMPVDSLDDAMSWRFDGRLYGSNANGENIYYLQTQDRMILELIKSNNWLRPIYFANTVSQSSQLNLQDYFRTEGKAYRIVPKKRSNRTQGYINTEIHTDRLRKFEYNNWNDSDMYLDENIRRMLGNYRYNYLQLSERFIDQGLPDSAAYWLKLGEEKIPFRKDEEVGTIKILYANRYAQIGRQDDALRLVNSSIGELENNLFGSMDEFNASQTELQELNTQFEDARRNADMSAQRTIRQKMNTVYTKGQDIGRNDVMSARQAIVLAQYVYFISGDIDKGLEIAEKVNTLFKDTPFPEIPSSEAQSKATVSGYGL
mgnify:CR=1 FL=1|tara:strand:+ start:39795 stop:42779 length:2985 start_codon:yes stop_codon:yes gene_type:complete